MHVVFGGVGGAVAGSHPQLAGVDRWEVGFGVLGWGPWVEASFLGFQPEPQPVPELRVGYGWLGEEVQVDVKCTPYNVSNIGLHKLGSDIMSGAFLGFCEFFPLFPEVLWF